MAKDLLYRGLEAFAPEVDEEEKKKEEKKEPVIDDGTGKTLYEQHQQSENAPVIEYTGPGTVKELQTGLYDQGYYKGIYPEGTPREQIIDDKYGKYTAEAERRRKAAGQAPVNFLTEDSETSGSYKTPDGKFGLDVLDGAEEAPLMQPSSSITTDPTSNSQVSDPYHAPAPKEYRTVDEFFKDSGLSDIPELKGYTDERRVKRAGMQQNFYNLAQALRTVAQSAASNSGKGAYIDKFEQDRTTPRIQAELARVREANDAENRRVNLMNWQNKLKNADIKSRFIMNQENQERANERQDKALIAQDKRYKQQDKQWEQRYGFQTDPEYIQTVSDIRADAEIRKQKEVNEYKKDLITEQANKEIMVAGLKAGHSVEEINKVLKGEGKFDKKLSTTGSDKTVKTITRDGKEVDLTQVQVEDMAFEAIGELGKLPVTEQFKLPPQIQKIIINGKTPTAAEARFIVGYMYPDAKEEKKGSLLVDEEQKGSLLK